MAEMRYQVPADKLSAAISFSEIHRPDEDDWGTGTFTTTFKPSAFTKDNVASMMFNPPRFQISAVFNENGQLAVALGKADGSNPSDLKAFVLPKGLDRKAEHTLRIEFGLWRVLMAYLDGNSLRRKDSTDHGVH